MEQPATEKFYGRTGVRAGNRSLDEHIARRVRQRRIMSGITQDQMGDAIGVTYQQHHKYETGQNRISSSILYRIANVLGVTVDYFFQDFDGTSEAKALPQDRMLLELAQNYKGIRKQRHREAVAELARALFQSQDNPDA